jgi:glucose-fructose oxidoreductase
MNRRDPGPQVRYAVVGLGWFAQVAILPAFEHASKNSRLVALFSDDADKLEELGKRYDIDRLHTYEEYDGVLQAGGIDAVYVALPNHLHCAYTERAARAGVHVLCEKPMAVTEPECERMIRAAKDAGVKLMIAYRLHFEAANLEAIRIVGDGEIGEDRLFASVFANEVTEEDNIRLGPIGRGGGTLYDIGIYCINAARYVFRAEPTEVTATSISPSGDSRFRESDEMTSAMLRFPGDRLAVFTTSFGALDHDHYEVLGTKGVLRVEPAFGFSGELGHELCVDGRRRRRSFPKRDQVAPELLHFSHCILEGLDPEPSGREGLADVRIIRALLRSAEIGRPVALEPFDPGRRPGPELEQHLPPVAEPELVDAKPPSED